MKKAYLYLAPLAIALTALPSNAASHKKPVKHLVLPPTVTVYRPTTFSSTSTPYLSPGNAIDTSLTSAAVGATSFGGTPRDETWFGFPTDSGQTPKVLKVLSAVTSTADPANLDGAEIRYSLNGGSTWTTIYYVFTSRSQTTDSITLPANQDITKVRVSGHVDPPDQDDTGATIQQRVYDIRIEEGS
jgi:hypothetical protein